MAAAAAWESTGDATADAKARKAGLRRANALRKSERKTMKTLQAEAKALRSSAGEDSPEAVKANTAYYKQKARVDLVTELIQATEKAAAAAAAEVDKAKFSTELDARDQRDLKQAIEKMQATKDAAGRPDQAAANALLATFEDDLQFEMEALAKKMEDKGDKAKDSLKRSYYAAVARYQWVSKELGDNSPAKAAKRAAAVAAAAEAALRALTGLIAEAKDVKDVLAAITEASEGTSPLPALLAKLRSNDAMKSVLKVVADDKKLARKLAKKLLAA